MEGRKVTEAVPPTRGIGSPQPCDPGTSVLAALGDRNLVFSEDRQAIYELHDLAAFVWRCLDEGLSPDQIVHNLVDTGVARDEARRSVTATLEELSVLRSTTAASPPSAPPATTERLARLTLAIAGMIVQLHVSKTLLADVQAVFGHLVTDAHETDVQLCVRVIGSTVHFLPPGRAESSCELSHFVPLLKAQLIDSVLRCAQYEVALHAAAVARKDDALLLVGSPGAGKTTLGIALARAGFEPISDDVLLLDQDGRVTGLPFPFTAKATSWSLISSQWPDLTFEPSYCRPDGQTVSYINQIPLALSQPRHIEFVILLDRQDRGPSCVHDLDLTHALKALIEEGATRDERLSAVGFKSLVDALRKARCCRLTYSDLSGAVDAVRRLYP